MIEYDNIFNNETLNIFSDASVINDNNYYTSCPGSVAIIGEDIVDTRHEILEDCTNNRGEIYAIVLGISSAIDLCRKYNIKYVNLYSDSKISVFGLREWIFNWMNKKDILYTSSGSEVKNQDLFILAVRNILDYNLNISLFHLNGHTSGTNKARYDFAGSFRRSNALRDLLDEKLIDQLIYYNNYIDKYTREQLQYIGDNNLYTLPVSFSSKSIPYNKYKSLISNYNNAYFMRSV